MSELPPNNKERMQWTVLGISGFVLIINVVAAFFNPNVNTSPSYYLFTAVSGLVFGATALAKWKQ